MTKRLLLMVMLLLMVGVASAQGRQAQVAQWASSADATSQYTDDAWSVERVLGEPDVQECADNENAWASLESDGEEALAVYFDKAVTPTQVNIFQTYNPGAIVGIDLIPEEGDEPIPVANSADPGTDCPGVLSINLEEDLPSTVGVIIYLDQSRTNSWNEIDAVELVGLTAGDPSKSMESSLESGDFDEYEVTSIDAAGEAEPRRQTDDDDEPTAPSTADYDGEWGTFFECDNGIMIENGIDVTIIQQRGGGTYRVTAVGLDDFDPILAVRDGAGNHICNDDDSTGATYSADLPTTGRVRTASTSSQVVFTNNASSFADITLTVGGYGGMGGEFIVIVEGMVATSNDGSGDPFSLYVSPALLESGVTPTAYNIAVTDAFDAVITLVDGDYNIVEDDDGNSIYCDDSGNANNCWGISEDLSGSYVTRSQERQLGGWEYDAMLSIPLGGAWGGYFNYVMAGNNSFGDYVAVFHLGTSAVP